MWAASSFMTELWTTSCEMWMCTTLFPEQSNIEQHWATSAAIYLITCDFLQSHKILFYSFLDVCIRAPTRQVVKLVLLPLMPQKHWLLYFNFTLHFAARTSLCMSSKHPHLVKPSQSPIRDPPDDIIWAWFLNSYKIYSINIFSSAGTAPSVDSQHWLRNETFYETALLMCVGVCRDFASLFSQQGFLLFFSAQSGHISNSLH